MIKAHQVILREYGGPEKMEFVEVELASLATDEVLVRQTAIGFNFIDTYQRNGLYQPPLPTGLGYEGVGIVEAIGSAVRDFTVGMRVAYMNAGLGSYADYRNIQADKLVKLPDTVTDEQVAAFFFKGMTAQYLLKKTYKVQAGDIVVVHAAAGGVGQLLCQWSKALGAFVIGTVGSAEKVIAAKDAGADVVINYSEDTWVEQVVQATNSKKANVVYDSVGKDTFLGSLDCVKPFGMMVLFGAASGPAPMIAPEILNKKGCLYLTRPSVFPHNADTETFRKNALEVFAAIAKGDIKASIGQRFALKDIVAVHRLAEERKTKGATVILP
ncbi:MAG TPA: quinone oxidoreductase [Candidatus Avacidaminococcus intestinavium]|uniref:Quinone oxidoreductase n=1 Tax=Candidatus Avacidaminococcus intestinavium TaxID=2840684 RepID=A0A9D1MPJ8_9FIRM|nr:quinone oxidoreductase [Candidatus Avacidaminococcus intestinavium]